MQLDEMNDLFIKELYSLNDFAKNYFENKNGENIYQVFDQVNIVSRVVKELRDVVLNKESFCEV